MPNNFPQINRLIQNNPVLYDTHHTHIARFITNISLKTHSACELMQHKQQEKLEGTLRV